MSSQLTHERCSELLNDYLAGALQPEQHRLVEDHLAHCAQCSAERAGLAALRSGDESEGLTGDERVALRAAVLGAATSEPERARPDSLQSDEFDAVVVPLGGRASRAGKYLGIAAMLAILAVGSLYVLRGGGLTGSDDSGDADSAVGSAEDSGSEGSAGGEESAGDASAPSGLLAAKDLPLQYQSDRGAISEGDLDRLGRRSVVDLSSNQAASEDKADPESAGEEELLTDRRASEDTLGRLAARAPVALAPEVGECGRTALEELDQPGLAVYATTATLEGTEVIVIGFVTGDRTPDRYAVFAFSRGDCTTILSSAEGPLE